MNLKYFILLTTILLLVFESKSQVNKNTSINNYTYVFKDTIGYFLTDSLISNLGKQNKQFKKFIKRIKYIGNDIVSIMSTETSDPHYICLATREPLVKNKVYEIEVCFSFHIGSLNKQMSLLLSNGSRITYSFKGEFVDD